MIYTVLCGNGCDQYKKVNDKYYARYVSTYYNYIGEWEEIAEATYKDNEPYFSIA